MTAVMAAPFASAQDGLDLGTAREFVLSRSSTLKKARLAVDSAILAGKARVYEGLPSITASSGGTLEYKYSSPLSDGLGASVRLAATQTIFDGGRQAALARQTGFASDAASEELRAMRVELIGQADTAFCSVLKAAASVDAAAGDLAAAGLRLQIASVKMEAGVLAKSEYLMTESEAAAYETSLIKAKKTLASAKAKLASLTGLPVSTDLEPIDFSIYDGIQGRLSALDETAANTLAANIVAIAAVNNPGLAGYALAIEKARLAVDVAGKGYAPTITASLSQGLGWAAASGLSVGAGSFSLTANLSLNLWATKNGVESATAAAASAALDKSDGERSLILDIDVAVNELLGAVRSIASSAKALEYAESNYLNVLERFKLSSASASELSSAEALVSTDRTAFTGARYDFLSCLSVLRGLAGLESEVMLLAAIP